ncbi:hypothetical protein [Nakamurella leprariae]|uniref:Uncharacterized protein n=1 Tax=Nakamurella leprariae TaxID=2803911 RepID=A0A938Y8P4_9ACTN|nr:hypothetical protein [Nakamurella leprariae]MBM9468076.1 hypothetical protein [Nakamurella leprariae]
MKPHGARRLARHRKDGRLRRFGAAALTVALAVTSGGVVSALTAPAAAAAAVSQAGQDYATTRFADPWDYANPEDILLDNSGPAWNLQSGRVENGAVRGRFSDNGYISPLWGGYGGSLLLDRDGGRAGNAIDAARYTTVSFQAWSDRDVAAGLMWFDCPGGGVDAACGGGLSFALQAGWHTYVLRPTNSVYSGWPRSWSGQLNGLRLAVSPGPGGSDFALDWFRVAQTGSSGGVSWSNPGGGRGDLVWDANGDDADNVTGRTDWGVLGAVSGASGTADLSALPSGDYRIGVRSNGSVSRWTSVTLDAPLPRVITPNAVGDRDYATDVLGDPWDMNGPHDVAGIANATDISWANGRLAATNTSVDPSVRFRVGAGGLDGRVYRHLTITSGYDGPFDLRDAAGGGTMGRVMWNRTDGRSGQTNDVLTYGGTRTVTVDLGAPDAQLLEPEDPGSVSFASSSRVTEVRWDPNEDRGARRWWVDDVQLRSDFATTGTFPITWQDASGRGGGSATLTADTDRTGCNGTTVARNVPVAAGTNTTSWNTAGVAAGRYWLCLTITRGAATTSTYATGVLVVGTPPVTAPNRTPVGSFDGGRLDGANYTVSGWAFDPDTGSAPVAVDVWASGPGGVRTAARLSTGGDRPDVGAVVPGAGPRSGFSGSISLPQAGRYEVCLFGIDSAGGTNPLIGCRTVDVPGPVGSLDGAAIGADGSITVSGWTAEPAAPGRQTEVHLYVTGPAGTAGYSGTLTGQSRPDVARVVPWAGGNTGWSRAVQPQGDGEHRICAFAIGSRPEGANSLLGCSTVTVRSAFGALDSIRVSNGQFLVEGWALDPNRPQGQVEVHVYDTGPSGTRGYAGIRAGQSRPDVAAVFPGYGPAHGLRATVPAADRGTHTVCAFAISTGGAANALLGCRTLRV